jgi:hypothetical protein
VLTRIPHDRRIAESYSRGELIIAVDRRFEKLFQHLAERVTSLPGREDLRDESSE